MANRIWKSRAKQKAHNKQLQKTNPRNVNVVCLPLAIIRMHAVSALSCAYLRDELLVTLFHHRPHWCLRAFGLLDIHALGDPNAACIRIVF